MENSMIDIKNNLIEWIENTFDLEVLQKIVELKSGIESPSLISDINSETSIQDDFDEQFAAGMTSDELMENITAHIETMASEESSSVVSDTQSEYAVKDDFDERFAEGLNSENARKQSKEKVREWWGK
ncbi:hypothetical protein [Kaistella jeonii]|uniref:Uncharacterized protein n=1 Tax=Kaistella jeonii TaxID=266749 RepID=A0A0C1FKF7_9FLAO|nr:hypothetical protein [Kaistella jeonii]KIA88419.1 hypothetical protein OA86_10275 [Kaistella jeonii]SFC16564.1 hypothetical protein SAMN05421876_10814 [Kaistella jeonii]VEI95382.1 Uncharacterised protein [Kaistella jeonii]